MTKYVGLGKTLYNTSVATLASTDQLIFDEVEIYLSERLTREKACSRWPTFLLENLNDEIPNDAIISENRDVKNPSEYERDLDRVIPFFDHLKKLGLDRFTKKFNSNIFFLSHHLAHAYAALAMSPYSDFYMLIMDGSGSSLKDYKESLDLSPEQDNQVIHLPPNEFGFVDGNQYHEEYSFYHVSNGKIRTLLKKWQQFKDYYPIHGEKITNGIGIFYEMVAQFIFNSKRAAGKVMGLADFGTPYKVSSIEEAYGLLDWNRSFKGKSKVHWEASSELDYYKNLAATAQYLYENYLTSVMEGLKSRFGVINNLVFSGGCALNCTFNAKMVDLELADHLFVPPFPGDECISLGCAYFQYLKNGGQWSKVPYERQSGYFGPKKSIPSRERIKSIFSKNSQFEFSYHKDIDSVAAKLLHQNKILAWFQDRSESGPRALGNRSILSAVTRPDLKNFLNNNIKFRESFRPYGCSCLFEKASLYFECQEDFNNPYMSFAIKVRDQYKNMLKEVMHIDGTSRMQTVRMNQNIKFYKLLLEYGKLSGLYLLLNTSLNIMGEPIVETIEDFENFMNHVPVDAGIIQNYLVTKKQLV